jgi:tetratricopeptide (TPR) repeat protein
MRVILFFAALSLVAQDPPPDIDALLKTARASYRKADYAAARTSLEQALTAADALPAIDPKRYEILKQLSGVLGSAGNNEDAEKYIQLAINWRETANGREDPLIAEDLIELATVCERRKDFDRAIDILRQVAGMHAKAHGNFENADVADDFSRIALVQAAQDKPDLAIPTLATALQIREKILGGDSPGLLPELDRMGSLQVNARFYESAETTFRRALVIRERVVGSKSADLLTTLDGLSYSLFGQKKFDDAEVFYKRLLDLWTLIGNQMMIAETEEKIAVFYREQGKWEQGTQAAGAAIALRALVSAAGLSTEATAWIAHGDKQRAIELYKKAVATLDPERTEHDGLREQLKQILMQYDSPPTATKSTAPKSTKSTAKKTQP